MYGKEFKERRQEKNITQAQLAKETGIPQQTISWIESDKGIPNLFVAIKLATYYGLTIEELIDNQQNNPPKENSKKEIYEFEYQHNTTKLIHKEKK